MHFPVTTVLPLLALTLSARATVDWPRPNACASNNNDVNILCCEKSGCPQYQNGTIVACLSPFRIFAFADCIDEQAALNVSLPRFDSGGLVVCSKIVPNGAGRSVGTASVGAVLGAAALVAAALV